MTYLNLKQKQTATVWWLAPYFGAKEMNRVVSSLGISRKAKEGCSTQLSPVPCGPGPSGQCRVSLMPPFGRVVVPHEEVGGGWC